MSRSLVILSALFFCSQALCAQQASSDKIAWYGIWEEAKAVAKATNRPIFLLAAAPQCRNVPGIW